MNRWILHSAYYDYLSALHAASELTSQFPANAYRTRGCLVEVWAGAYAPDNVPEPKPTTPSTPVLRAELEQLQHQLITLLNHVNTLVHQYE